jgi:hypothetical protein
MSALPVTPMPEPTAGAPALSEGARVVDTFIAPSKTFTDLRRNASWWGPLLLMIVFSLALVYVAGQKVGFRKITENQMQAQPKQQERMEQLPAAEREQHMQTAAKFTMYISYCFPVLQLLILLIIAAVLFATFKFAAGADVKFKVAFAIVMYAGLPGLLKAALAILSLLAGASPDSFTFQNPLATNPGYFMNAADSPVLYGIASSIDIFMIWTLALTAIGFTCVSRVKRGTSIAIVFGWWIFFTLALAGLAAAFS